jgi:hypothetical protein
MEKNSTRTLMLAYLTYYVCCVALVGYLFITRPGRILTSQGTAALFSLFVGGAVFYILWRALKNT